MFELFKDVNSFDELIDRLTPEIYQQLKTAVEIGKWPNRQALRKEQRELCLQAVIAYEKKFLSEKERTGYVPPKKTACNDNRPSDDDQILTLK